MNLRTIGTIEIVAGALLAALTLVAAGTPRTELYVIAAALFISGHIVLAETWRRDSATRTREEARVLDRSMTWPDFRS